MSLSSESVAILSYLEAAYPDSGTRFLPKDLKQKARVLQLVSESVQLLNAAMDVFYFNSFDTNEEEFYAKVALFRTELELWEGFLTQSGGPYSRGSEFSMIDLITFPLVATMVRYGMDFKKSRFPHLAEL